MQQSEQLPLCAPFEAGSKKKKKKKKKMWGDRPDTQALYLFFRVIIRQDFVGVG